MKSRLIDNRSSTMNVALVQAAGVHNEEDRIPGSSVRHEEQEVNSVQRNHSTSTRRSLGSRPVLRLSP